jgi:DNA (cytosine-5)-methyltransferase 1
MVVEFVKNETSLFAANRTSFESALIEKIEIEDLLSDKKAISYKRYLSRDERKYRKDAIDARIEYLKVGLLCSAENKSDVGASFEEGRSIEEETSVSNCQVQGERHPDKPVLAEDAPIAVILFAGGGGVEAGMVEAGIRPVIAVELDPDNPQLSSSIIEVHETNFSEYGCKMIRKTVQQVALEDFEGFPIEPDYLHSSNVCKNFSIAKKVKGDREQPEDIDAANAVVAAISKLKPKNFTLEQVPGFKHSESFKLICQCLKSKGYTFSWEVLNLADYGVPQVRQRLLLRAGYTEVISLPPITVRVGWYDAISAEIPQMKDSALLDEQQLSVSDWLSENAPLPLLVDRTGGRSEYRCRPGNLPAYTQIRSHFTDGKGANRNKFADIRLVDGTVKSLSIKGAAILQGFPDWYEFPSSAAVAGTIIGNSVPPSFAAKLFSRIKLTKLDDLLTTDSQEVQLVPTPLISSIEGTHNWINLHCGHSLNPDFFKPSWVDEALYKVSEGITRNTPSLTTGFTSARVLLTLIEEDTETQSRNGINPKIILEYLEKRKSGVEFPPVVLFFNKGKYYIGDGWHRYYAEKEMLSQSILAEVKYGTKRDAVLYSCGANANHGLRRSSEDKRKSVLTLLKDDEWSKFSNREIARRCGVDEGMVRKYRQTGAEIPHKRSTTCSKEVFPRQALISGDYPESWLALKEVTVTCRPDSETYIVVRDSAEITVCAKYIVEIPKPVIPINSVKQETKALSDAMGIPATGLPSVERNEGIPTEQQFEKIAKLQGGINQITENSSYLTEAQAIQLIDLINFGSLSEANLRNVLSKISIQLDKANARA